MDLNTHDLERILQQEENWFHAVTSTPLTRYTALRMMRHAIWYVRSRRRDHWVEDGSILLKSLVLMKKDSVQ